MKTKRQLILGHVGMGTGTHRPFDQVFPKGTLTTPEAIEDGKIDALVIWGGEDISPSLYNEKPSRRCGGGLSLSYRDRVEKAACDAASMTGIPIIGVCRGAQLLCALAGGRLIQHVNGHGQSHLMDTVDGQKMVTSSVHHQMMYPWDVDHELIAWSSNQHSECHYDQNDADIKTIPMKGDMRVEPEIVYFPKIKGLAIQGHPEFMRDDTEFVTYCNQLVRQYLLEDQA